MITKTFICDKCGKSVGETDLINLKINAKLVTSRSQQLVEKDICKECLKTKGILTERKEGTSSEDLMVNNAKTFRDKFIELLNDLEVVFEE